MFQFRAGSISQLRRSAIFVDHASKLFLSSVGATSVCQSQRDCVLQPRVATKELPWVNCIKSPQPQRGCGTVDHGAATTPLGLKKLRPTATQGSSCLATLGFEPESLWDSPASPLKLFCAMFILFSKPRRQSGWKFIFKIGRHSFFDLCLSTFSTSLRIGAPSSFINCIFFEAA